MLTVTSLILVWVATLPSDTVMDDVLRLDREILGARERLLSGEVRVVSRFETNEQPDPVRSYQGGFWFDGDRIRNDVTPEETGVRSVVCVHCEGEGNVVVYRDPAPSDGDERSALKVETVDSLKRTKGLAIVIEPRWFGLIPSPSRTQGVLSASLYFGHKNRRELAMEATEVDGAVAWIVSYEAPSGALVRYATIPERDHAVPWMSITAKDDTGREYTDRIHSQYASYAGGTIWFPTRCEYTRSYGDRVVEKESLAIDVVALDKSVPADTFRLAGLNLDAGTPVLKQSDGQLYVWDGGQVLDWRAYKVARERWWQRQRFGLIAVSVVAASIALLTYRWLRRQRVGLA